jgi:hypothetical protein
MVLAAPDVLGDLISVRPHLIEQVDHDLHQFARIDGSMALELGDQRALLCDSLLGIHDVAPGAFYVGLPVAHLLSSPGVPIDLPCCRQSAAGDRYGLALGMSRSK